VEDGRAGSGELGSALRPRYVAAPVKAGFYESLYLTAHHPTEARALWVRHTVSKPPGQPPRASLWCTWFAGGEVRAGKVSTPQVSSTADHPLEVAEHGWMGVGGAVGAIDLEGFRASWDLRFEKPEPPMFHLPKPWMYTAPVPRTKSTSAAPMVTLAGRLEVEGEPIDLDGWPCTIGHNWGAEHAERWIWLHADAASDEGPVWLDVVVGRVRLGPVTTPWIANGGLSIAGERHRLGGLRLGFATPVTEHDRGATVKLRGSGLTVEARSEVDLRSCVAWTYADPAGATREVVNCSVARSDLTITREGKPLLEPASPVSAFEIGARRRALDVPLQPFPD
jgi:hypothetical protein